MADLTDWNVRGPVWRLRTELAEWDPTHGTWQAARGVSAVTFRRDGQISDGESHYPNGSVRRWARLYDDGGRMIEAQASVDDGHRTRVLDSYDLHGRVTNAVEVAAGGTRRQLDTCSYDAAGRKTKDHGSAGRAPKHPEHPLQRRGLGSRLQRSWSGDADGHV